MRITIPLGIAILVLSACSDSPSATTAAPSTTTVEAAPSAMEEATIAQVRSEAAATTIEITRVDTVRDADLVSIFRSACASFDEGSTVAAEAATFIEEWAEHATVRDDDRRMADYFFTEVHSACGASATN